MPNKITTNDLEVGDVFEFGVFRAVVCNKTDTEIWLSYNDDIFKNYLNGKLEKNGNTRNFIDGHQIKLITSIFRVSDEI